MKRSRSHPVCTPAPSGRRTWRPPRSLLLGATGALLLLVAGWLVQHFWLAPPAVALPEVDLSAANAWVRETVTAAEGAVRREPSSAAAWGELGIVLYAHAYQAAAAHCFAAAETRDSADYRWPYYQGLVAMASSPAAALPSFERARALAEDLSLVHLRLADTLYEVGRIDASEQAARRTLELAPDDHQAELLLARIALRRGQPDEGRRWAERAVAGLPRQRGPHEVLAKAYQQLGERAKAAEELQILERFRGEPRPLADPLIDAAMTRRRDTNSLVYQSEQLLQQGRGAEAIRILREVAAREPHESGWQGRLGRALMSVQDYAGAAAVLDQAIEQHPRDAELYVLRGVVFHVQENFAAALDCYTRALECKPDYAEAYFNQGLTRRDAGRRQEAAESFLRATALKPSYAEAHYALGVTRRELNDLPGALESLAIAAQLLPENPQVRLDLAEALIQAGKLQEAQHHVDVLQQLAPDEPRVRALQKRLRETQTRRPTSRAQQTVRSWLRELLTA